ncbi:MAG: hypothetical protein ACYS5W_09070 [Planctomycetota bacterium]|jgi:hypothetical protein
MKSLTTVAAVAALVTSLSAQGPTFHSTLPAGLLKTGGDYSSGNGVSYVLDRGVFHYQEVHKDWLGKVKVLQGVSYRRAWNRANDAACTARKFDMLFRVGYGDLSKFTKTSFNSNYTRGRKVMLGTESSSGNTAVPINLPSWVNKPVTAPAPFNAIIPFKGIFVYDAKDDFIWELEITKIDTQNGNYYCDRHKATGGTSSSGPSAYVPATRPPCNDSAITRTNGAYMYGYCYVYNSSYSTVSYRDKLRVYNYSYYTAPGANVAAAISPFPLPSGVNIGAICNRLYFDASKPFHVIFRPATNDQNARTSSHATTNLLIPWNNAYANIKLMMQTAWSDSKTGFFSLTAARSATVPSYPKPLNTIYTYRLGTATTLNGPYSAGSVVTGWY